MAWYRGTNEFDMNLMLRSDIIAKSLGGRGEKWSHSVGKGSWGLIIIHFRKREEAESRVGNGSTNHQKTWVTSTRAPFFFQVCIFFFFRTGLLCISSLKVSQSPTWLVQLCFASHLRHYNQQNKHHHLSFFSLFKLCELFFQVIQRPNAHSLFQLQEFSIIRVVLIKGEEKRQNDADWYQHDGPTVLHRLPIPR